ncbi:protein o-linked-mannose beta-1,2-n-acetylglucosaminyltransferase 1-like [Plakobranchus ocellatus]|uniref:Protein o-linked-mannose beta-1,2-n-acetylglucosaminyltransferase 1-like n=1 Tax=Plakobranchus ocellatus TaxID=259542 RepID=A0AAV4BVM2_9GAST|nr:protein o-linked-mannose beta-1,2-n-acetylglucosaminyltransferase 1-like [Plakobranchus ocellatus]
MVFTNIIRSLRRVIHKKFGGYRRFLLVLLSTVIILYVVRAVVEGDGSRHVWDPKNTPAPENKTDIIPTHCQISCAQGQLSFYIKTGEKSLEYATGPTICFEGKEYMSDKLNNVGRGFNIVLVDAKTKRVKAAKRFDTFLDDSALLRFLKKEAVEDDIVLAATYDDAATMLKESGRQWLGFFGSGLITRLKYRENFLMVGAKALAEGNAIEYYMASNGKDPSFAPPIEKAGCFALPMGPKVNMDNAVAPVLSGKDIEKGERNENCGLPSACAEDSVSAAVFTGQGNEKKPSICINGDIWMADKTNDAGRGFNIVVLDPTTFQVTKVTHMDTYDKDSTDLELLLDSLDDGDIIVAVVSDEASRKLGTGARDALNKVGSAFIQNLRFRDVWYFVGQKGIQGFSRIEQLSYSGLNDQWPKPLEAKFCIPRTIPSSRIMIDAEMSRNEPRRQFCTKYEGYTEFCNPAYVDEQLKAIPISNTDLSGNKIFQTPIIIVPGINHNAYVNTLRTTLMQPGIDVKYVAVYWDEKIPEYGELAGLFGFQHFKVNSSTTYAEQMTKAMKMAKALYPTADHMMFIEEDLLLAPDFMPFMAQTLNVVTKDESLAGSFAWNINGWYLSEAQLEMLMPDVSRAYRTPFFGGEGLSGLARKLFLKPRKTYLDTKTQSLRLEYLISKDYEHFLTEQIHNSIVLKPSQIIECIKGEAQPPAMSHLPNVPIVIFYQQQDPKDYRLLLKICQCFGLVIMEDGQPRNMHRGMLRFYYQNHDVFVVGTQTSYFDRLTSMGTVLSSTHFSEHDSHIGKAAVASA